MPISAWICPHCGGRERPLDHFASTTCGELIHPDYAAAVLKDRSSQYVSGVVRVSHGLGCPRKAAIEYAESYAINPLKSNAPLTGVAWHNLMEAAGPVEKCEVRVSGEISGIPLQGKIDRIRALPSGEFVLEDWKHGSDRATSERKSSPPKERDVIQLSVYAELTQQTFGERPVRGIIWGHGSTEGAIVPQPVKLLPIDEVLAKQPFEGDHSVIELYAQADEVFREDAHWSRLPLAGASMKLGNRTACDYCDVRTLCTAADRGAPF